MGGDQTVKKKNAASTQLQWYAVYGRFPTAH